MIVSDKLITYVDPFDCICLGLGKPRNHRPKRNSHSLSDTALFSKSRLIIHKALQNFFHVLSKFFQVLMRTLSHELNKDLCAQCCFRNPVAYSLCDMRHPGKRSLQHLSHKFTVFKLLPRMSLLWRRLWICPV